MTVPIVLFKFKAEFHKSDKNKTFISLQLLPFNIDLLLHMCCLSLLYTQVYLTLGMVEGTNFFESISAETVYYNA